MLTRTAIVRPGHGCPVGQVKTENLTLLNMPAEGVPCEHSFNSLLLPPRQSVQGA